MKRYSHVFSLAFTVETDHAPTDVTATELWRALEQRCQSLGWLSDDEMIEACQLAVTPEIEIDVTGGGVQSVTGTGRAKVTVTDWDCDGCQATDDDIYRDPSTGKLYHQAVYHVGEPA